MDITITTKQEIVGIEYIKEEIIIKEEQISDLACTNIVPKEDDNTTCVYEVYQERDLVPQITTYTAIKPNKCSECEYSPYKYQFCFY